MGNVLSLSKDGGILKNFIEKYKPIKFYGIFVEGHTWNDPCPNCQDLFRIQIPLLKDQVVGLKEQVLIPLRNDFFILPLLSSQKWYKSKRPKPSDLPSIKGVGLDLPDGRTLKVGHYDFFQHTADYKKWFEDESPQKSFSLKRDFISQKIFPCFWLPGDEEVQTTLQDKMHNTFTKGKRESNKSPLVVMHPNFDLKKRFPIPSPEKLKENLVFFTNLTDLDLASNQLSFQGAGELSKVLPQLTHLQSLNLRDNMFGKQNQLTNLKNSPEFNQLIGSFSALKNLRVLNLSENYLSSEAGTIFSQIMISLSNLKSLSCEESGIDSQTSNVLILGLPYLTSLEVLSLKKNHIQYESADKIITQSAQLPKIKTIDLSGNQLFWHLTDSDVTINAISDLTRKATRVNVTLENGKVKTLLESIKVNLDDNIQ